MLTESTAFLIIEDYTENTVQREFNPIVIHAPSYREVKGTKYIVDAVDKLKSEGLLFEFKLLENIPFRDVLQYYTDGDIMVGQILAPGGGKQEREGLHLIPWIACHPLNGYGCQIVFAFFRPDPLWLLQALCHRGLED